MTRGVNKLSARRVETEKKQGWHGDGAGLYLRIGASRRSWVYVYQWQGKRAEHGIGPSPAVSLAEARQKAQEAREAVRRGERPGHVAPAADEPESKTFGAFADECIDEWNKGFRNPKHRQQWINTVTTYCEPIASRPIQDVTTEDVLAILKPIWLDKHETADRLRGRIERILAAARAIELIKPPYENPARWKGHLEVLLPKFDEARRGNFKAILYEEAPAAWKRLRARDGVADRALQFTILTCVRSHMTRGMTWREVKGDQWVIPKLRLKRSTKDHTVPLTPLMIELMGPRGADDALVFPGRKEGSELSDGALERPLDFLKLDCTVHGWRSTFKDWASNETDFPDEVSEEVLAHVIKSKTKRAYRRREAIAKRRALLEAWEQYLAGEAAP